MRLECVEALFIVLSREEVAVSMENESEVKFLLLRDTALALEEGGTRQTQETQHNRELHILL